jgi:DHA3 family macrolide efflux protein-like MFS transporter
VWHITLETKSGAIMTLFTLVGFLPMFLISPFGGVWADRFNRKNLINLADAAIALASLVVALLLNAGYTHFGILLACAAVRSLGQGVQMPASGAFVPLIVPPEHLTRVSGIQTSVQSLCMFGAPMISGLLMTFAPLKTLFLVDVVTAGIGIVILQFFVRMPQAAKVKSETETASGIETSNGAEAPAANKKARGYFHDLREGLRYARRNSYILRMVLLMIFFCVFSVPISMLTPLQVTRDFGDDVWRLMAIEIAFSVGMMVGGIVIGVWGGFRNKIHTMALACFLFGLISIALGLAGNFWLYIGIMALAGVSMPFYNTPSTVMLQMTVDNAFMGRVLSVFSMIGSVMMPLGMLFFGPLADSVPIDRMLIVTGVLLGLMGIPLLISRPLREAGEKAVQPKATKASG